MNSLQIAEYLDTFASFKERAARQLKHDGKFSVVLAKDGVGKSLAANNDDALIQQFTSLVQDEHWRPLGIFALSLGGSNEEFGKALMATNTQSVRIERLLFQQPPSIEDAEAFGEVIAAEVKKFSREVPPR